MSVAADLGVVVLPHPPDGAAAHALREGATLARPRLQAGRDEPSLSPVSLRRAAASGTGPRRLVLPSPNGSTICRSVGPSAQLAAGSLRNGAAAGGWLGSHHGPVAVVASGERWPDGSLRPALEDLYGAGAVLAAARAQDPSRRPDPDARAAIAAYDDACTDLGDRLRALPSALELVERGFAADVEVALEVDASALVPVLQAEAFTVEG